MLYDDILETIGNTPLVRLNRVAKEAKGVVYAKIESRNPGFSVKDRIADAMVEAAESEGLLKPGYTLVEPTSGNTGIGLAMVAAVKGYRIILTMPESMSMERRALLRALGAQIVLTPAKDGMDGAVRKAEELVKSTPDSFMPQQFKNPANPGVHAHTTAEEIWKDTRGRVTHFVAGVGTGGTISGVGNALKGKNPQIKIIAVEPEASAVISGEKAGPHGIQGIGAGFIPTILDRKVIDRIVRVKDADALTMSRRLMREEGILAGISSGANVSGVLSLIPQLDDDSFTVVILPDTGERYISTDLFSPYRS